VRKFVYELNQAENHKQKAQYVEKIFDSAAPVYDLMNTVISLGLHKLWRKYSLNMLEISPGDQILDGCCGTADVAMEMAKMVGPGVVVVRPTLLWKWLKWSAPVGRLSLPISVSKCF
jgi:demethylmenaquinone methyltransferase/2-methoxy-6-polyprenyl-1,4-benzoquinol methylase